MINIVNVRKKMGKISFKSDEERRGWFGWIEEPMIKKIEEVTDVIKVIMIQIYLKFPLVYANAKELN